VRTLLTSNRPPRTLTSARRTQRASGSGGQGGQASGAPVRRCSRPGSSPEGGAGSAASTRSSQVSWMRLAWTLSISPEPPSAGTICTGISTWRISTTRHRLDRSRPLFRCGRARPHPRLPAGEPQRRLLFQEDLVAARVQRVARRDDHGTSRCRGRHAQTADHAPAVEQPVVTAQLLAKVVLFVAEVLLGEQVALEVARTHRAGGVCVRDGISFRARSRGLPGPWLTVGVIVVHFQHCGKAAACPDRKRVRR